VTRIGLSESLISPQSWSVSPDSGERPELHELDEERDDEPDRRTILSL
jgi:hypothetical protein